MSRRPTACFTFSCRLAGVLLAFPALLVSCAPKPVPAPTQQPYALRQHVLRRMEAILARPELAPAHVGLAVWSFDRRAWLIERDADKLFVPASNAKILVAAAALHTFGPATRFTTSLRSDAGPEDSLIAGNLYLVGGGNPCLSTGDFTDLAERLRALGVRGVRGDLILDASAFDSAAFGHGWMWDEGPFPHNAPVNAFMLNENTVALTIRPGRSIGDTVRVEVSPPNSGIPMRVTATTRADILPGAPLSVDRIPPSPELLVRGTMLVGSRPVVVARTVADPVAYTGSVFLGALRDVGVSVEGGMTQGVAPDSGSFALGTVASSPMDVLVRRFLKESDNLVGETLVKQMGIRATGDGSWAAGLSAVRRALADRADLDSTTYRLADGSGLSRYTEISPRMIVQVIVRASEDFSIAPEFLSALAIGGVDGTLARRFTDVGMSGFVRGKTGTMSSVSGLSGVLVTRSGEKLAFSLLMNGFVGPTETIRRAQDDIVAALREWPGDGAARVIEQR